MPELIDMIRASVWRDPQKVEVEPESPQSKPAKPVKPAKPQKQNGEEDKVAEDGQ